MLNESEVLAMADTFRNLKRIYLPILLCFVLLCLFFFPVKAFAQTLGDVNGDGLIDVRDAVMVNNHLLGQDSLLTNTQQILADVNGDGIINIMDANLIMQRTLGLIDRFPVSNVNAPQLYSPAENAHISSSTITFQWHPVSGADRYELEIVRVSDGAIFWNPVVFGVTSATNTGFTGDGSQYRWRVRAGNIAGWGSWSHYRHLTNSAAAPQPAAPFLLQPVQNAKIESSVIDFRWNASSGASRYQLEISSLSDGTVFRNPVLGNVTSTTQSGFPVDGTHFRWRVRAGSDFGWGDWSHYRYFTNGVVDPPAEVPNVPILSSPASNAVTSTASIDFRWNVSPGADRYQLEVIRINDGAVFANPVLGSVSASTQTGFPVDGTQFRWRVRAGNASGWSAWSHYRYFSSGSEKTYQEIPNIPILTSPANNAATSTANLDFRWNVSPGADKYQLEVIRLFDGALFANPVLGNVASSTQTGFPVDGTPFKWRVRAGNESGWSAWSHYRYFTSGVPDPYVSAPPAPFLSRPVNNASIGGTVVDFSWNAASRADRYELKIIRVSDGTVFRDVSLNKGTASSQTGFPNDGTSFKWAVRAGNEGGWSAWSSYRTFTNSALPEQPKLSLPADKASVASTLVHFKWESSVGASKYNLEVVEAKDGVAFKNVVLGSVTTSTQTGFPNDGTAYKWRVRAGSDAGWGEWSAYRNLTNGSLLPVPPAPYLRWPDDGAAAGNSYIDFRWNQSEWANKYQLEIRREEDNVLFRAPVVGDRTISTQTGFPNDGTEYIWRVRAGNNTGWGDWSAYRTVVNGLEPSIPFLSRPVSNARITGPNVYFSWSSALRADEYELEVINDDSGTEFFSDTIETTSTTLTGFPAGEAKYKWRVRGHNNQGSGTWSSYRYFTLNTEEVVATLAAPVLAVPTAGANVSGDEIDFSWNPTAGAETYRLQIQKLDNGSFEAITDSPFNTVNTSLTVDGFDDDGAEYRWRVRAIDSDNNLGPWSGYRTFTNGTP